MKLIRAKLDYCGEPGYGEIYINPYQIIDMTYIGKYKNCYNNEIDEHYVVTVNYGSRIEQYHISIESGNKLLER